MYETTLKEIQKQLSNVPKVDNFSDKDWTRAVKDAVAKVAIGYDKNSRIYANNCEHAAEGGHEWLYDLVWAIDKDDWKLERLVLVMESEWSTTRNEQRYDFQKLLIAKVAIKLFVFQARSDQELKEVIKCFCEMIDAYKDNCTKESYLFAGLLYEIQGQEHFKFFGQDGKELPQ